MSQALAKLLQQSGSMKFNTGLPLGGQLPSGAPKFPTRKGGVALRPYYGDNKEIKLSPCVTCYNLPEAKKGRETIFVAIYPEHHPALIEEGKKAMKSTTYHECDWALVGVPRENQEPRGVWLEMIPNSGNFLLTLDNITAKEKGDEITIAPAWTVSKRAIHQSILPLAGGTRVYSTDLTSFPSIRGHQLGSPNISWEVSNISNGQKVGIPFEGPIEWHAKLDASPTLFADTDSLGRNLLSNPAVMGVYKERGNGKLFEEIMSLRMLALIEILEELATARSESFDVNSLYDEGMENFFGSKATVTPTPFEDESV